MGATVYVSYAWSAERETRIVDKLEAACKSRSIDLLRDIKQIGYGSSIRSFMNELGKGHYIIVVLSNAYFKSPNCMYELREIRRNGEFIKRAFPIVLSGTDLYDPLVWVEWLAHWEAKLKALDDKLKDISGAKTSNLHDILNAYHDFRSMLDEHLSVLSDMNALTQDVHESTDFKALLDKLSGSTVESIWSDPAKVSSLGATLATPNNLVDRESRLCRHLIRHMKNPLNRPVMEAFVAKLHEDLPTLSSGDTEQVMAYLLAAEGEQRYRFLARFLAAAAEVKSSLDPAALHDLLAFLLQTLVRRCGDPDEHGISVLPVQDRQTAELVSVTRTGTPYVPSHSHASQEFRNGRRDPRGANIGDFFAETGIWDVESKCNAIASNLLVAYCGYRSTELGDDPITKLKDVLDVYRDDPENAPLTGLFVRHDDKYSPVRLSEVARRLYGELNDLLWIYEYGSGDAGAWEQWLHARESQIGSLIRRYERDHLNPAKPSERQESGQEQAMKDKNINVGNIGNGAVVNFNYGTQTDSPVGHGNVVLGELDRSKLREHLRKVQTAASEEPAVSKQDYAAISHAAKRIEEHSEKADGGDPSALKQAVNVLSGFKDIATLTESIQKITEVLLPFLG